MGQRGAAQPAEAEDDQTAAWDATMGLFELGDRRVGQHLDRGLGDAGIAAADLDRVARAEHDLRARARNGSR